MVPWQVSIMGNIQVKLSEIKTLIGREFFTSNSIYWVCIIWSIDGYAIALYKCSSFKLGHKFFCHFFHSCIWYRWRIFVNFRIDATNGNNTVWFCSADFSKAKVKNKQIEKWPLTRTYSSNSSQLYFESMYSHLSLDPSIDQQA